MDLTGINNYNEYYTNHYFTSIFEDNAEETISIWRNLAKESEEFRTPWSLLRESSKQYYSAHEKYLRSSSDNQVRSLIIDMADSYLKALSFPSAKPEIINVTDDLSAPVYLEINRPNGAPLLWIMLANTSERDANVMQGFCFNALSIGTDSDESNNTNSIENEELITKILFAMSEPPRWIIVVGFNQIALIDRNKWNEKRYLHFDLEEIFSRREETTFQAMAVLLHKENLCPIEGASLLDKLDENSHKHASGVSQDLKYALRESIELLGNEVIYDIRNRLDTNASLTTVDPSQLTIECLRYMYRMLFVFFIESRPELGYAPMKSQVYVQGYSIESLRDIADGIREEISEVGEGYYLHETISKLFDLIYNGYPKSEESFKDLSINDSLHDVFLMEPLKAHIFDPELTPLITSAKLRNRIILRIIDLMSLTRSNGNRNGRRGRISYAALGINQMGAVYEALLSYRGFIAEETLFEVKRERDQFNELDVGYFVSEGELDNYTEEERVRYDSGENQGKPRKYEKGTFIYRLAGREREKSASYYTPEVLTKCLVKYALKELLEGKAADEILQITICEPAMGSAAFLNEAINQLAEAYLDKKQKEIGETISYENRYHELQRVKMYIADRNVYGIDLNPIAVELAEVSLWLNTIYKGAYVPWFGTQLVNGNSLIGARRQCYGIEHLKATQSQIVWYNKAPERIMPGATRQTKKQVYHFLLGDPGMSNYTDKVIKELAPENIQSIKAWNKKFTMPFNSDDLQTILRLSEVIDDLWKKQVGLRKKISSQTADTLSVYGHSENIVSSHTSIREKDLIYKRLYKSEEMENAGPYARLNFAMDYWCSLWFWPIDKAELLPSRSEFLFDMSLILEGGIMSVKLTKGTQYGDFFQMSLFQDEMIKIANDIKDLYEDLPTVDLNALCERNPRLQTVKEIANQNKFMHWELEFADLFEERSGFDLILGNPPWIKIEWNEQSVLADSNPIFAIKQYTATQASKYRFNELNILKSRNAYMSEYTYASGTQNYLNAIQNYPDLIGIKVNLFKCFIPIGWTYANTSGIFSFLHPEGVYNESTGGDLRSILYKKLRAHYQFQNQKMYFDIGHRERYSINIYSNSPTNCFDTIANIIDVKTIDSCYEHKDNNSQVPGIKGSDDNWSTEGHYQRIVKVGKTELVIYAKLFDGSADYLTARLPALHCIQFNEIFKLIVNFKTKVSDYADEIFSTQMWQETGAQTDGIIERKTGFPDCEISMIYSGPHIGVSNPIYKTPRNICDQKGDYDTIDLTRISENYIQRTNYQPFASQDIYNNKTPVAQWGAKYIGDYRVIMRRMLNLSGERTLIPAIIPPYTGHIHTINGFLFKHHRLLIIFAGVMSSIIFDSLIKNTGRGDVYYETLKNFPLIDDEIYSPEIIHRTLLLNCVSNKYKKLWDEFNRDITYISNWSKNDVRLKDFQVNMLEETWNFKSCLRVDYERRQALLEIDVLTAMALGMTLDQLKIIYRIQFPVLQSYESDTWYDQNGRIVFTNNRSLNNVGFSRSEWNEIKEAKSGVFTRIISDDTMPGGPIERTIEYIAPFDRCDREQDYKTAWDFFEKKHNTK